MRVLSASQMAAFDRECIEGLKIPGLLLMEHAGHLVAKVCQESFAPSSSSRRLRIAVFCGGGNNGGDGFVAARHLLRWGHDVSVYMLKEGKDYRGDARQMLELLTSVCHREAEVLSEQDPPDLGSFDMAIDALFGTGLSGELRGMGRRAVDCLEEASLPKLAVDIPSGLSADEGRPLGRAVRAEYTLTMGLPKIGFFSPEAQEHLGGLIVGDIGFPRRKLLAAGDGETNEVLLSGEICSWLPRRSPGAHKGSFGKLLIVAGSKGMVGASVMAARAAMRAGVGLTVLALPESIRSEAASQIPEVMTLGLPDEGGFLRPEAADVLTSHSFDWDALLIGPGMGRSQSVADFQAAFLSKNSAPAVIDADGLYHLRGGSSFQGRQVVLTPHEGEAARLASVDLGNIHAHRQTWLRRLSHDKEAVVLLKGPFSLIGDPSARLLINPTGNEGMATGGSGDVLSGIIASFLAQKRDGLLNGAALGAYLHGLCADLYAQDNPSRSMIATDLLEYLPEAFSLLEELDGARRGGREDEPNPYPSTIAWDRLEIVS